MKIRVTLTYTYDLPDDPEVRKWIYDTTDPELCAKIDSANAPEALLSFANPGDLTQTLKIIY